MSGRIAGTLAAVAAVGFAVPAHADVGVGQPTVRASHRSSIESPKAARPTISLFDAVPEPSTVGPGRVKVRFRIGARSRNVGVRLNFMPLLDGSTYRVKVGRRKRDLLHTFRWNPGPETNPVPGGYNVRIVVRDARGRQTTREATFELPGSAATSTSGRFPVAGSYHIDGAGGQFGAPRGNRRHQGQDISAPEGTPVIAPTSATIYWRAYQARGAGYYLVLDSDSIPYHFAFLHLEEGSLLVRKGDRVQAGQQIASVGNTGRSFGAHLHFEVWDGMWYGGGKPINPLPLLKAWEGLTAS
jgi:murein DD-endopeptidase MepM/ murein hydrolase activator NlpD